MPVTITLGNDDVTMTISTFDSLTTGSGAATITVTGALVGAAVDLGTGTDSLTLANFANSVTVSGAETLIGGSAVDTITLGTTLTGMTLDLEQIPINPNRIRRE